MQKDTTNLRNYRNKTLPYFDRLMVIFGKDWATRKNVEALANVVKDLDKEEHTHRNNELLQDIIGLSDDDIQDIT